jgi:hypothetical protein
MKGVVTHPDDGEEYLIVRNPHNRLGEQPATGDLRVS